VVLLLLCASGTHPLCTCCLKSGCGCADMHISTVGPLCASILTGEVSTVYIQKYSVVWLHNPPTISTVRSCILKHCTCTEMYSMYRTCAQHDVLLLPHSMASYCDPVCIQRLALLRTYSCNTLPESNLRYLPVVRHPISTPALQYPNKSRLSPVPRLRGPNQHPTYMHLQPKVRCSKSLQLQNPSKVANPT